MTRILAPLPRIAALSVAIALSVAPTAAAQSPVAAPPVAASANPVWLSDAAFARLARQPSGEVAAASVVKERPRLDVLHYGSAVVARQAQAAPVPAPLHRNWVARHKVATGFMAAGAVAGTVLLGYFGPCLGGSSPSHCD